MVFQYSLSYFEVQTLLVQQIAYKIGKSFHTSTIRNQQIIDLGVK